MREVQILNHHASLSIDEERLSECIHKLDNWGQYTVPAGELSLVFPNAEEMCQLHATFLNDPTLTDVITFDGDPLLAFAGEIFVSLDQAKIQAPQFDYDLSSELTLYVVHGWLHLAGLEDTDPESLQEMKQAEQQAMTLLGKEFTSQIFVLH